jgi:ABC-type nitrate/sulfonate/bicarbonate transport system ATPase subunit
MVEQARDPVVTGVDKADKTLGLLAAHIVRAVGVRKTYVMGGQPVHALRGVNFSVMRGQYVSIMGPSGSGKSTLFNMIGWTSPTRATYSSTR